MADFFGFNPPFLGGPQNVLSRQEDDQLIKNDLLQLLRTNPGDRLHRHDFGVPLRDYIFDLERRDLSEIQSRITEQIERYEPRVNVEQVIVRQNPDKHRMEIRVIVTLKRDPRRELIIEDFLALSNEG